jgi:hypothetical protein
VKKAIFKPAKQKVRKIPESGLDSLSIIQFGIDHFFDKNDFTNITYALRKDAAIYGFETIFGEPVETKIFYDDSNITKSEIIKIIESEEVELPLRDGSKLKREINFEVADDGKLLGKISINEYEKNMFKAYDRKFNKYSKQNIDSLKVLIYPMKEAGKSLLYKMLSYLTSHLSGWNGIFRLSTKYDSVPQAYIYFNESITPLDTVKAVLSMEKMKVHFRGGTIKLVDNPFKSKPDGVVKKASEINSGREK